MIGSTAVGRMRFSFATIFLATMIVALGAVLLVSLVVLCAMPPAPAIIPVGDDCRLEILPDGISLHEPQIVLHGDMALAGLARKLGIDDSVEMPPASGMLSERGIGWGYRSVEIGGGVLHAKSGCDPIFVRPHDFRVWIGQQALVAAVVSLRVYRSCPGNGK